jgi:hypothetical protein
MDQMSVQFVYECSFLVMYRPVNLIALGHTPLERFVEGLALSAGTVCAGPSSNHVGCGFSGNPCSSEGGAVQIRKCEGVVPSRGSYPE